MVHSKSNHLFRHEEWTEWLRPFGRLHVINNALSCRFWLGITSRKLRNSVFVFSYFPSIYMLDQTISYYYFWLSFLFMQWQLFGDHQQFPMYALFYLLAPVFFNKASVLLTDCQVWFVVLDWWCHITLNVILHWIGRCCVKFCKRQNFDWATMNWKFFMISSFELF